MRKIKLLWLGLLVSLLVNSQAGQVNQINIVSFTVKPVLPGTVDNWLSTPAALILVAQKVPGPVPLKEPKLVIQIKSGGAVICGNNPGTAKQIDPFDVRTFNTADLIGILGNCHELKEGMYTICVQFYSGDRTAISREVCKEFRVEAPKTQEYAPPTLITPENEKKFTEAQLMGPVTFRWTPLVPKPNIPVTYRLKVWQLMQGQNATTAMRTNQPIVTKDVDNLTQATVNAILTGPCKPPYLCDFIWNVQALTREGKPLGNNNGFSEPLRFSASSANNNCPANTLPENSKQFSPTEAKQTIQFKWTNVAIPGAASTYRLKVWQLMQGQNGSAAMKSNQPIVTKEIRNTTEATVSGIYTGPCKPPYLCDFVWAIEMLDASGGVSCTSEGTRFSVKEEGQQQCPVNTMPQSNQQFSPAEAKQSIQFRWTPIVPKPRDPVTYRLKVWQLMQGQNASAAMRSNQPIVTKDVADITEATVSGIYTGPCRPPYLCDFVWAVETRNAAGQTSCTSEGTGFSVKEESQPQQCPVNVFPEDKKKFTQREAKAPLTFKWTNTATPGTLSAYKMRVWQLMQGQNPSQAMKASNPIITRQVSNANEVTINGILTGPCKPPYLCDFIWNVDMIDASGRTLCSGEPTVYKIANNDIDIQIDSVKVECCKDGKQNVYIKLKNNLATPVKITQIKIDKVNGTTTSIVPSPLAPALPFIIPGNGSQAFTGQINCIDTAKIIRFFVAAEDPVDNAITETEVEADTLHCACDACDEKHFVMNVPAPGQINTTTTNISFNQPMTIVATPPKTVKTIKAELVYFEMIPENDQCIPCDKDARLYGHFTNGTNNQQWNGPQSNLNITITTPVTPCCSTVFRWCIRYIVEFSDCTVCSKVICYEKKKSGCVQTGEGTDNPTNNLPK